MLARCPDKDGGAADRCLEYHRISFTLPCKKAIAAFERAAPPRTPYESLATLAPISGPIPPAEEREAPSRPSPRAGTAATEPPAPRRGLKPPALSPSHIPQCGVTK